MSETKNEVKFLSLREDAVFKALWLLGSDKTKKKLREMISYVLEYDISDYENIGIELPITNYESIFNKTDLLLLNKKVKRLLNIELNNKVGDRYVNKNNSYLYKIGGEFYGYLNMKSKDNYKVPIRVTQFNINCYKCPEDNSIITSIFKMADLKHGLIDKSIIKYNIYVDKELEKCYDNEKLKDYLMFVCDSYEEMEELARGDEGRMSIMGDVIRLGGDIAFTDHINSTIDNKIIERQIMEEEITEEVTKRVTEEITEKVTEEVTEKYEEKTKEMISSMYKKGIDIEVIAEVTKLSTDNIRNILKHNKISS